MRIKNHVFISVSGELLPRWKKAFAVAAGITPEQLPATGKVDIYWLRLQSGAPADLQINALRAHVGNAVFIVLSDTPVDDEAMSVFTLAARGYANTHAATETLKQIAKVVDQGGLWIGESLMQRLLVGMQRLPVPTVDIRSLPINGNGNSPKLTGRELEVARAIAGGASNKEVARQLNITERTVKAHVSGLFAKLDVHDRLHLALRIREISN